MFESKFIPAVTVWDNKRTQRINAVVSGNYVSEHSWEELVVSVFRSDEETLSIVSSFLEVDIDRVPEVNVFEGMSVCEISSVYEFLLSREDGDSRVNSGQFFTPDDVAHYMGRMAVESFPDNGSWYDPCCGVGNLIWHVAAASDNPESVVRKAVLGDMDERAVPTACVFLAAAFTPKDQLKETLDGLWERRRVGDFLTMTDDDVRQENMFVVMNPPYVSTKDFFDGFECNDSGNLYSLFLEKAAKLYGGFVAVTPFSFTYAAKYAGVREMLLQERCGGRVWCFNNIPDALFRGVKFGSTSTSTRVQVRAAITVSAQGDEGWMMSPYITWKAGSRERMWESIENTVSPLLRFRGLWAKILPGTERVVGSWFSEDIPRLDSILSSRPTGFRLEVASSPRYYISAAERELNRTSKFTLFFHSQEDLEKAYVLLNSSVPFVWWKMIDGGVTLPLSVLRSTPLLTAFTPPVVLSTLSGVLRRSEGRSVVVKRNAGKDNENIKHPRDVVEEIDRVVVGEEAGVLAGYAASDVVPLFQK